MLHYPGHNVEIRVGNGRQWHSFWACDQMLTKLPGYLRAVVSSWNRIGTLVIDLRNTCVNTAVMPGILQYFELSDANGNVCTFFICLACSKLELYVAVIRHHIGDVWF